MTNPSESQAVNTEAPVKQRGRPAKHVDAAAKQKAYRDRRRQNGLPADTRQDIIKSLRDEITRLRSGQDALRRLQQELLQREAVVAEQERVIALAQSKPTDGRKVRDLEYKVFDLERELQMWKFKKADRLHELLAKRIVMPKRDLAAVFLVDYAGKPIEHGYEFERATKGSLEFGRKAATAASAISEIVATLDRKRQTTPEEKAILDTACKILGDIHGRAAHIKENAKTSSTRIKREEAAREEAAEIAVAMAFPKLDGSATMFLAVHLGIRHSSALDNLSKMKPETATKRDIDYYLEDLANDVRNSLQRQIENALIEGRAADATAQALRRAFDEARPDLEVRHKALSENIRVCQVAAELVKANSKGSTSTR